MRGFVRFVRAHRDTLRICGGFVFFIAAFFLVTSIHAVYESTVAPFTTFVTFVAGGLFSVLAGFIGMRAATRANVRTAEAARLGASLLQGAGSFPA